MNTLKGHGMMIDHSNLNAILGEHDFKNNKNLVALLVEEYVNVELVVYDTSDMLEQPTEDLSFQDIVRENALDAEDYEIDRIPIIYR